LGVLAELGVPGLVLFVGNFLMAIRACWRISRQALVDPSRRELGIYANALITSLVVFAAGGTFLSSQYNEMFWHFVGLSTALWVVAFAEETAAEAVAPQPGPERPYAVAR
jgi:O-antigen ligase